jgi:small subunit ribosomal protein S3
MGQKVHPVSFRLGITQTWRSRWYANKRDFGRLLVEDVKIRRIVKGNYRFAGIARIDIERTRDDVTVTLHTARPGIVIGRKGVEVDRLRGSLEEVTGKKVNINIVEISRPELSAQMVAESMAEQLSKRAAFRRTMKRSVEMTMDAGAEGVRIQLAGRLGGAEMSRRESTSIGKIPLHTLRANIDYGFTEAATTYGHIGVKVWINLGEVEAPSKKKEESTNAADAQAGQVPKDPARHA